MSKLLYFERLLSSDGCLANSLFLPCDRKRCLSDKFCKVFTSAAHSLPYSCTSCWSSKQGQLCPPSHQCGAGRSSTVWSLTATVTALDDRVLKLMSCCSKNKFALCCALSHCSVVSEFYFSEAWKFSSDSQPKFAHFQAVALCSSASTALYVQKSLFPPLVFILQMCSWRPSSPLSFCLSRLKKPNLFISSEERGSSLPWLPCLAPLCMFLFQSISLEYSWLGMVHKA